MIIVKVLYNVTPPQPTDDCEPRERNRLSFGMENCTDAVQLPVTLHLYREVRYFFKTKERERGQSCTGPYL